MNEVKVIIWGFGAMGSGMAKMLTKKTGIQVVGVCDRHPDRVGKEMYSLLGIERNGRPEVFVTDDIDTLATPGFAHIALLATDSFTVKAYDKIVKCLEAKMNVISTAEEMAFPQAKNPELAVKLDNIAKENGVTLLGTGINPGFVLDLLVLALTGTCESVDHIEAARVNDLAPFGPAVMQEQGVGLTKEEFIQGVADGTVDGHVGFPESIGMIAHGLGWDIDRIEETREPIMTTVDRETEYIKVKAGNVAGCKQLGYGYDKEGKLLIKMEHPQQICPQDEGQDTGDYITIHGVPNIKIATAPEIPGGVGTIAMVVNSIVQVLNAQAGLVTMLDIPVPRAIMGDIRHQLKNWE